MARSHEDTRYSDINHHNTWNYCSEISEKCSPGSLNERSQLPSVPKTGGLEENNLYANANSSNDVYMNKHTYNARAGDSVMNNDDKASFNNISNGPRQNYGNAVLSLDSGHLLRVFYDENNHQLIFPNNQYELFANNQGICDIPIQSTQTNIFAGNPDYTMKNNIHIQGTGIISNNTSYQDLNQANSPSSTSNILKEVLDNLEPKPNPTGSYSPFGQNYPLNHPDTSNLNIHQNNSSVLENPGLIKQEKSPKRNENTPLADNSYKKRIVAEVKPMRPSYSDVLAKNTKNSSYEATQKVKPQNIEIKLSPKGNSKTEKPTANFKQLNDENNIKNEKKLQTNSLSSGSESGDVNTDDTEKHPKQNKKNKNKRNMSRKWSSVNNLTNEENTAFDNKESQFVFIENQSEKATKKEKKTLEKIKSYDIGQKSDDDSKHEDEVEFIQENQNEGGKLKKKKERNHYNKPSKPVQDKKKCNQLKFRKNKPGYLGLAQNYLEHWSTASWKAVMWFILLLSDICRMSAHLSFDLCTSVFTQTYVSFQAVWRSSKEWIYKVGNNKYLHYIDRKLGHTRFGFWRKFFKKDIEVENNSEHIKLNANIPLPATGDEAMKRLLACKGKDPYSILGVSVTCTDEEIKRYYRRQAFLVHPDKNQQPGAEEAFKILQHAFDLIGEPERREAYERRAQESRHVEAAWSELSHLLAQLHDKMEFAANTIRCTNCGRRHKRVLTDRPCYAARYCVQCKIRHSAKEGDIWAESSMMGLLVMYYACMDGAVYQITQWASCQKKNLKQLRPDCHVVQYRIVLGNKAAAAPDLHRPSTGHDPNLEEFLNNLYSKSGVPSNAGNSKQPTDPTDVKKRRNKKTKI